MSLYQPQKQKQKRVILSLIAVLALVTGFIHSQTLPAHQQPRKNKSAEKPVVIAYQTGIDPGKIAQANNAYEKATGKQIIWKKFDSGAGILTALAAGDVDIANIGSAPFSIAASRGLPVKVFYIAAILGTSEALIIRNDRYSSGGLTGKKIAVPFTSTAHYSLLAALAHLNIDEKSVQLINLRPAEIVAAWEREDIDAAYVWEPALSQLKASGQILMSGRDMSARGKPTYDLWVAENTFAEQHSDVLARFVAVTDKEVQWYNRNKNSLSEHPEISGKIAALTGSQPDEVAAVMSGNDYPGLQEQTRILATSLAGEIRDTALFLQQQGSIDTVKTTYAENISIQAIETAKGQ